MLKKALLVGINEYQDAKLRGCVNDVMEMKNVLTDILGFQAENIRLLRNHEATKKGITEGLTWLAADGGSAPATRVFHYAGHGHYLPDQDGEEGEGGRDEALVPYGSDKKDYLIDDELKKLYDRVPPQDNLTLIMDCCHSGNNQRAPDADIVYRFIPNTFQERKAIMEARRKFNQELNEFMQQELKGRGLRTVRRGPDEEYEQIYNESRKKFEQMRFGDRRVQENNILLAACQDDQKAADAQMEGGVYHGAFTFFLVQLLRESQGQITYREIAEQLGENLYEFQFQQLPQLECKEGRQAAAFLSAS